MQNEAHRTWSDAGANVYVCLMATADVIRIERMSDDEILTEAKRLDII